MSSLGQASRASAGRQNFSRHSRRAGRAPGKGIALLVVGALLLVIVGGFAVVAPHWWRTYTDPATGASFRYPPSWLLATDPDGSHGSIINPTTRAVITEDATAVSASPSAALNAVASNAPSPIHRDIAGSPALDFTLTSGGGGGATGGPSAQQARVVAVAVRNRAATTNLYLLTLTTPSSGMSDDTTFNSLIETFSPTSSGLPLLSSFSSGSASATPAPVSASARGCGSICWADANWTATDYSGDASGRQCASYDDNAGQYVNCAQQATTLPGTFQPDFQCAEFVARALAQAGLVPGLASGGSRGAQSLGGVADAFGSFSYNAYPFTSVAGGSAASAPSGDTTYNLLGVGVPGTPGLYDYLVNSGIGVSLGQRLASAAPGDLVFFYSGTSSPENREHVMLITSLIHYSSASQGLGGWDALLDGHNRAAYHSLLSTLVASDYPFEIIHLRATHAATYTPATTGAGWMTGTDGYGQSAAFAPTTSAAQPSATAAARFSPSGVCELAVYVPSANANALMTVHLTFTTGATATSVVDESALDGWALVYAWGASSQARTSGPALASARIGNATGSDQQSLGIGPLVTLCAP